MNWIEQQSKEIVILLHAFDYFEVNNPAMHRLCQLSVDTKGNMQKNSINPSIYIQSSN